MTSSMKEFLQIQHLQNPGIVFDPDSIQKQITSEELDYFLHHPAKKDVTSVHIWPWTKETEDLYIHKLEKNPFIRTYPQDALEKIRSIYNETAIKELIHRL